VLPTEPPDASPLAQAASTAVRLGGLTLPMPHIFYGWWVVFGSGAIVFIAAGTFFYGFSAIFDSLVDEFGWSHAAVSLGFSMRTEVGGIFAPLVGYLVDRVGPRKLLMAGVIAVGLGFLWMSRIDSLWSFYGAIIVIALGMGSCGGLVGQVAISNWFERQRGRALAIVAIGPGASGIMVMILAWLMSLYGWRGALAIMAVVIWATGLPLAMLVRRRPEDYGLTLDGEPATMSAPAEPPGQDISAPQAPRALEGMTLREALRTRAFWFLALAFAATWFGTTAIVVHEIPALTKAGFSREFAALMVTLTVVLSLGGRLGFGWLADLRDKRLVLAGAFLLQALGILVFAFATAWWQLVIFLALYPAGYGGMIPVRPAFQAQYFGRRALGAIMGFTFFVTTLGSVIGPVFVGGMYDILESYRLAFVITALMSLAAIPLALSIPRLQLRATGLEVSAHV
jgi:MFS family permease